MNKVFNINLGGYPFTIDDTAYEVFSNYLKKIHQHFRSSEGYEEITADIEARMAELFTDLMGDRPIVTVQHVNDAIGIMGRPEEFGAEPLDEEDLEDEPMDGKSGNYRTGRRLFRDADNSVVSGVCSGIASYFGIEDPIWIRLGFVIFTMLGGSGILMYLILLFVMPEAQTASDRLAMKGKTINASNIGKIIEEEMEGFTQKMEDFGDKVNEWGDKVNEKYGGSKKKPQRKQVVLEEPLRAGSL